MSDDPDQLRAFLAERDVRCPNCGYNLRALTTGVCPECRQELTLAVHLAEPYGRALVAAAIGLSLIGGVSTFWLTGVTITCVYQRNWPSGKEFAPLVGAPAFVSFVDVCAVAWLAFGSGGRWFGRLWKSGRRLCVIGCWALAPAIVAVWIAWVMTQL